MIVLSSLFRFLSGIEGVLSSLLRLSAEIGACSVVYYDFRCNCVHVQSFIVIIVHVVSRY